MSKHTVNSAIQALVKKGVIVTQEHPITKRESRFKDISMPEVLKRAKEIGLEEEKIKELQTQGKLLTTLGITSEKITVDVTLQEPFTLNIGEASDLGNGSWGKIDFLKKQGFKLIKQPLYGAGTARKERGEAE